MKKKILTTFTLFLMALAAFGADTNSKSFSVGSDPRLDLKNVSGDIKVSQGGGDYIEVRYTTKDDRIKVNMEQTGDRVSVEVEYPRNSGSYDGGVDFEITFPETGRLQLNTVSGNIEVEGIHGRLELAAVSGDLKLTNASGEIEAGTVSGDVILRSIGESEMEATSVSGDVDYEGSLIGGDYTFNSTSGEIKLTVSDESSFRIKGNTVSGRISSDVDGIKVRKDDLVGMSSMSGTYNGGDVQVSTNSVSGRITIRKK